MTARLKIRHAPNKAIVSAGQSHDPIVTLSSFSLTWTEEMRTKEWAFGYTLHERCEMHHRKLTLVYDGGP